MKNYLFLIILILTYSCKEKNVDNKEKKVNKLANEKKIDTEEKIQLIGKLYQPEKMVFKGNRIGTNVEKEDYQITLTNSDLLDSDLKNKKKYADKIATIYCSYLGKTVKPFNFKKIIVKIEHRNGKTNSFEYSVEEFTKLLNLR